MAQDTEDYAIFTEAAAARKEAEAITNAPRRGIARIQFIGAWDAWIVEVHPRQQPYGNPRCLRTDGTVR